MSDILLFGRQQKTDKLGRTMIVTRVQRIEKSKYSSRFNEMKQLLDEQKRMQAIKTKGDLHEKESQELQETVKG